ncbi:MAG: SIS domain-containing protein [Clostridia bacterium]|nr:SIS domain-containing protein [Clostridia bacterium]
MFEYFDVIRDTLDKVQASEGQNIERAAEMVADSISKGRPMHYFAAGHSHMLGEELFYRAGGLVPVNVLFEPSLMMHNGAAKSSKMERLPGFARIILEESCVKPGDVMVVVSTSGANAVPVQMAIEARNMGVHVVAVTSITGSRGSVPRNPEGKRLFELGDVVIDSHVPCGDASVSIDGLEQKIGPISTVIGASILNTLVVRAIEKLMEKGMTPPVFMSANIPGGAEHNEALLTQYKALIRGF